MSKRDKSRVLPMYNYNNKQTNPFVCHIDSLEKYKGITSGKYAIPERCDDVRIPVSVFNTLIQGEQYLIAEEDNRLLILPCTLDDEIGVRAFIDDIYHRDIKETE